MNAIGSPAWLKQTHGALNRRERKSVAKDAVAVVARDLPGRARFVLDRAAGGPALVPPEVPHGPLFEATKEYTDSLYSPVMLGHCLRAWWFGTLFAEIDGIEFDPEVLWLAALLHDITLTEKGRLAYDAPTGCFAAYGAELGHAFLIKNDAPSEVADQVAEAIGYHANPRVPNEASAEAQLLSSALSLDLAGLRAVDIGKHLARQVITAHPRDAMRSTFITAMRHEAHVRPHSRAAVLWRVGFAAAIGLNPLDQIGA